MKIGFLADTHSNKTDGSDLPDAVLKAFDGVDLIVHLGDIGRKAILDRLGEVATVWVQSEDRKGYVPVGGKAAPAKLIESGGRKVGLTFNLAQPDKKIAVGPELSFDGSLDKLLQRRFKDEVQVVAFAATHATYNASHDGVLFFNPGSPTLPADGPKGSVALLDLGAKPKVKLIRI